MAAIVGILEVVNTIDNSVQLYSNNDWIHVRGSAVD